MITVCILGRRCHRHLQNMLEFTTPQSGDPQKNKSVLAHQVRRHAAKVAAARQRKTGQFPCGTGAEDGAATPLESCFLLNLDRDTEQSRETSASVVRDARERTGGKTGPGRHRPKWTSVYRLDKLKRESPMSTPTASPSSTTSPYPIDSSSSEVDLQSNIDTDLILDYANDLPWTGPFEPFADSPLDFAGFGIGPDDIFQDEGVPYHSLLTLGKHIPDAQASLLAFDLGSGFQHIGLLPSLLKQAQRRAVCATVALDQYQRESVGAPLLEDIVDEAELSQAAFQAIGRVTATTATTQSLLADCCRLAGLIYCELVLFPSLSQSGAMARLASELWTTLETLEFWLPGEDRIVPVSHALLWVTVLGAMAESTTRSRDWFIRRLSILLSFDPRLCDWHFCNAVLSKFLWWRPICDRPGRNLWNEAINIHHSLGGGANYLSKRQDMGSIPSCGSLV
jgi:hypothetical protein